MCQSMLVVTRQKASGQKWGTYFKRPITLAQVSFLRQRRNSAPDATRSHSDTALTIQTKKSAAIKKQRLSWLEDKALQLSESRTPAGLGKAAALVATPVSCPPPSSRQPTVESDQGSPSRGQCKECDKPVLTNQQRIKFDGGYMHQKCKQAFDARQLKLSLSALSKFRVSSELEVSDDEDVPLTRPTSYVEIEVGPEQVQKDDAILGAINQCVRTGSGREWSCTFPMDEPSCISDNNFSVESPGSFSELDDVDSMASPRSFSDAEDDVWEDPYEAPPPPQRLYAKSVPPPPKATSDNSNEIPTFKRADSEDSELGISIAVTTSDLKADEDMPNETEIRRPRRMSVELDDFFLGNLRSPNAEPLDDVPSPKDLPGV